MKGNLNNLGFPFPVRGAVAGVYSFCSHTAFRERVNTPPLLCVPGVFVILVLDTSCRKPLPQLDPALRVEGRKGREELPRLCLLPLNPRRTSETSLTRTGLHAHL